MGGEWSEIDCQLNVCSTVEKYLQSCAHFYSCYRIVPEIQTVESLVPFSQ